MLIKDLMIMWKNLKLDSLMKHRSLPFGKGEGGLGHFSFYGSGHSFSGTAYEKISPELVMPIPALTIVCSKLQHPLTCGATGAGIITSTSAAENFSESLLTLYKTKIL